MGRHKQRIIAQQERRRCLHILFDEMNELQGFELDAVARECERAPVGVFLSPDLHDDIPDAPVPSGPHQITTPAGDRSGESTGLGTAVD